MWHHLTRLFILFRFLMGMEDLMQQPMLRKMRSDSFLKMLIFHELLKLMTHF